MAKVQFLREIIKYSFIIFFFFFFLFKKFLCKTKVCIRVDQVAQMASVKTSPGQHKNREIKQELRLIIIIITQKATEVRFK